MNTEYIASRDLSSNRFRLMLILFGRFYNNRCLLRRNFLRLALLAVGAYVGEYLVIFTLT